MTAPATTTTPGAGKRRWGKILTIIGATLLILGIALGVILGFTGIGGAVRGASDGTQFTGSITLTLEQGEKVQLYARAGGDRPSCEVLPEENVGPGAAQTSSFTRNGEQWESFGGFTAEEAGSYDVSCTAMGGDPEVYAGPPVSIGSVLLGVGGIFGGIGLASLGVLLLVIGIVLLVLGRRDASQARQG
ncbi:MAG: hypothetical protein Q4G34_12155 [Micrococcus sp.]|nr:hypothetical protein [Micrococcus sp.]